MTGWTYWLAFLIGPASEVLAAGTFLHVWFPTISLWEFCLSVAILMTIINLISAHFFGEVEFWLSLVKIIALLSFIIMGVTALGFHTNSVVSLKNFTEMGGFAPHGMVGVFSAMMLVIFAYGGTEAIGTAAEESQNPEKNLPKVLKGTVVRIVVLYIVSIAVLLAILPWDQAGLSQSPFVTAFMILGGNKYGAVLSNMMSFVVLTAALSCIDTGIFASSRMLFSLARKGYFPKIFGRTHVKTKTPIPAIIASSCVLYLGVLAAVYLPNAYAWLASLSGFGFLFAWLMIVLSQSRIRNILLQQDPSKLKWMAPFYPYSQILAVALMCSLFVGAAFSKDGRIILIAGAVWLVFASVHYFVLAQFRTVIPTQ
ncbi:MAG: amino acid permease [Legionellales bacterium]|nr:amino acid permease [Legionellales bacterium]